ncbi:MAG: hypothetical protein Q9M37_01630 [Desulfonauticus sp.]|nr:hypothetical protein [Desulfonauticus sp.]
MQEKDTQKVIILEPEDSEVDTVETEDAANNLNFSTTYLEEENSPAASEIDLSLETEKTLEEPHLDFITELDDKITQSSDDNSFKFHLQPTQELTSDVDKIQQASNDSTKSEEIKSDIKEDKEDIKKEDKEDDNLELKELEKKNNDIESSKDGFQENENKKDIFRELQSKGWQINFKSRGKPFVFDNGREVVFCYNNRVQFNPELAEIKKYFIYLVDYSESPGPDTTSFEGPSKYATILIKKKLESEGILTPEFDFYSLFSHSLASQQKEFVYHLLPKDKHNDLLTLTRTTPYGFLFLDTSQLLLSLLMHKKRKTGAFLLHLSDSILFLAGKVNHGIVFQRFNIVDSSELSIINAIQSAIYTLESKPWAKTIKTIDWLESFTSHPVFPEQGIDANYTFVRWPLYGFQDENNIYFSSLPVALSYINKRFCFNPKSEIFALTLKGLEKYFFILLFALSCTLAGSGYIFHKYYLNLKQDNIILQQNIDELKNEILTKQKKLKIPELFTQKGQLKEIENLAKKLKQAIIAPRLAQMWNILARLTPTSCTLNSLELNFTNKNVEINMSGIINEGMATAQDVLVSYLFSLEKNGFRIIHKTITPDLDNIRFKLTLLKGYRN